MWNYMLAKQEENYSNGGKFITAFGMNYMLPSLKKEDEYSWLCEVSNTTLQRVCYDLAKAYKCFFEGRKGHPKFKSRKKAKPTFPICCEKFYFKNGYARIQKIGRVKYKSDFVFPNGTGFKYSNVRLSFVNGKYMLSFNIECENQAFNTTNNSMGIDLGVKELAVVAYGDNQYTYHNINKSYKIRLLKKRIRYVQRSISRKYEVSKRINGKYVTTNNIEKQKKVLRRLHAKVANIRNNYINQITHALVSLLPNKVVMEDLNVLGMMKNRHLSNAIQEQCFYEFTRQMKYKCEWRGIDFVQVDRFYPSSKTCSNCGCIKHDLKLSDRTFVCDECGFTIDRDYQAALNLMRYEG